MAVPKTSWGKWSVAFVVICLLSLATLLILAATGQRGGETFLSNPLLAIPGLTVAISGTIALVSGVVGMVKEKERSVLVFLAVLIGLAGTTFWLGEILSPH